MVQDFTKVGISQEADVPDPLADVVRTGIRRPFGRAGVRLALDKLSGVLPMGVDAPTAGLRKFIGGGWELLAVLKYGLSALVFLFVGIACCYFGARDQIEIRLFGIGSLVLSAVLGRWTLHAARNLRAIAKA